MLMYQQNQLPDSSKEKVLIYQHIPETTSRKPVEKCWYINKIDFELHQSGACWYISGLPRWSCGVEALSVTASCFTPLPGIETLPGACGKVASDLGLGDGFCRVLRFPPQLQLSCHQLAAMWQKKWRKIKDSNSNWLSIHIWNNPRRAIGKMLMHQQSQLQAKPKQRVLMYQHKPETTS